MTKTLYEILEVAQTASAETIQAAYRSLMSKYHPDKVASLGVEFHKIADERTKEINSAYDVLRDPAQRAAYDRKLRDGKERNGENSHGPRFIGLTAVALVVGTLVIILINGRPPVHSDSGKVLPGKAADLDLATPPAPTPPAPTPPESAQPVTPPQAFHPGSVIQDCDTCPVMVVVPAGSFRMGTDRGVGRGEPPRHKVVIRAPFAIGKFVITQAEYESLMGGNPSLFKGATNPVENVTWYEAREFVKRLSVKTGKSYRLPSEAEWEYAARAGTKTLWSFGDDEKKLPQYAWFFDNSGQHTHPVGELLPNGFGLYDMHGNVSQWVEDCYPETYRETRIKPPADGRAWTTDHCPIRVIRSGSWDDKPYLSSSEFRNCMDASDGHSFLGFRVARTITP